MIWCSVYLSVKWGPQADKTAYFVYDSVPSASIMCGTWWVSVYICWISEWLLLTSFSRFRKPLESLPTPPLTSTIEECSYFSGHCPHNWNHSPRSHHGRTDRTKPYFPASLYSLLPCTLLNTSCFSNPSPSLASKTLASSSLSLSLCSRTFTSSSSLLFSGGGSHSAYISSSLILLTDLKSSWLYVDFIFANSPAHQNLFIIPRGVQVVLSELITDRHRGATFESPHVSVYGDALPSWFNSHTVCTYYFCSLFSAMFFTFCVCVCVFFLFHYL